MNNGSNDHRGVAKPVQELQQAIQPGRGQSEEPIDTGVWESILQGIDAEIDPSVATTFHATSLSLPSDKALQTEAAYMPEKAQVLPIVPHSSQRTSGNMYYQGCGAELPCGPQRSSRQYRKRKEPEVVGEQTARLQKRLMKNRESAARSRARKQEYAAQLEVRIVSLKQENQTLMDKVILAFAMEPSQASSQMNMRRTKTMPACL